MDVERTPNWSHCLARKTSKTVYRYFYWNQKFNAICKIKLNAFICFAWYVRNLHCVYLVSCVRDPSRLQNPNTNSHFFFLPSDSTIQLIWLWFWGVMLWFTEKIRLYVFSLAWRNLFRMNFVAECENQSIDYKYSYVR